MATYQTGIFFCIIYSDFEADNMLRISWNSEHISVLMIARHWQKVIKGRGGGTL